MHERVQLQREHDSAAGAGGGSASSGNGVQHKSCLWDDAFVICHGKKATSALKPGFLPQIVSICSCSWDVAEGSVSNCSGAEDGGDPCFGITALLGCHCTQKWPW